VLLYDLEISQESGLSGRRLGPGAIVIGGGLQADLVIPALLDAELCEIILPSTPDKPLKATALVEGLVVNGRELRRGQSISAAQLDLSADGVMIRFAGGEDEGRMLAEPVRSPQDALQDKLTGWLERAKRKAEIVHRTTGAGPAREPEPAQGERGGYAVGAGSAGTGPGMAGVAVLERLRANPGLALMGLALGLALLAFLLSGWPSARFTPPNLAGLAGADRDSPAATLAEIRRRLVAADLAGAVKAEIAGGAVRLSGLVDPNQAQRLGELLRVVAPRPGAGALRNEVTMASADAATGVEAVVTAPSRGVVVSGGRLFREGQTLPSGWLVEEIAAGEVRLKRDSMNVAIALTGLMPDLPPAPARNSLDMPAPRSGRAQVRGLEPISSPPPEPPRQLRPGPVGSLTITSERTPMGGPLQRLPAPMEPAR
jgi:hypothetical protein